jgi:hypothetical protein
VVAALFLVHASLRLVKQSQKGVIPGSILGSPRMLDKK